VATYGQVAERAGLPRGARLAGHALSALAVAAHAVPWQRVLGARGRRRAGISIKDAVAAGVQRALLEREGVAFGPSGLIDLDRFGWRPGGRR
jgi:methylated-DNA-protein-cysteine methyltransferase-like protein